MTFRSVFGIWLLSRLWHGIFVYFGHISHPFQEARPGGYAGVSNWWLNPWTVYDSLHFLSIAQHGYRPETTPFFPLYPLLLRPFGPDFNMMALAGIVISNLCFLGALWWLYRLTERDYDQKIARLSVWILAFFPIGAASMSVYTESLFLLLGIGTFWFARQKSWFYAGIFAVAASLTRNSGPIIFLALGWEWFTQYRKTQGSLDMPPKWGLLAVLAPLLAFIGIQLYFKLLFGDTSNTISSQSLYLRALDWPGKPLLKDFIDIFTGVHIDLTTLLNWGSSLLAIGLLWKYRSSTPFSDVILVAAILLIHLTLARTVFPYTNGSLRYLFGLWPFTQLVARSYLDSTVVSKSYSQAIVRLALLATSGGMAFLWGLKSFTG